MIGLSRSVGVSAAIVVAAAAGYLWLRLRRWALLFGVARHVTKDHARLLSVKRNQLVAHDGYGNYRLQPWIDHVDYFIDNVILREARRRGLRVDGVTKGTARWSRIRKVLLRTLQDEDDASADTVSDADIVSGEHYETLCRNLLQGRGWRVEITPMTGDQGADLIADAHGRRVVIQCKFHARSIGNKAVQEAFAAIGFHGGDAAVVVSNASYTRSARQLAEANGVLLLHHDQLPDLERLIRQARQKA